MSGSVYDNGRVTDMGNDYNLTSRVVRKMIEEVHTITVVRVVAVHGGGVGPVGTVDVLPLVKQVSGSGEAVDHKTLFGLPYFRYQGGSNAFIVDPAPGDIGIVGACSRDITKVKNTRDAAAPDTRRTYDISDGVYLGGVLGQAPTNYVRIGPAGVEIVSAGPVTVKGTDVMVQSSTLKHNAKNVGDTHVHPDPQGGTVGPPQ
jgi:hypothetical protein